MALYDTGISYLNDALQDDWTALSPETGGAYIPFNNPALVMSPGRYGPYPSPSKIWSMPEGLVSFWNVDESSPPPATYMDGGYRLFYQSDIDALIKGLAWLFKSGTKDDGMLPHGFTASNLQACAAELRFRKLIMTCGNTAFVVQSILSNAPISIPCRRVYMLSAGPSNGYDNGHTACEIFLNGKWVFVDFETKARFPNLAGGYYSAADLMDIGIQNVAPEEIGRAECYDEPYQSPIVAPYIFREGVYWHTVLGSPRLRDAWRARTHKLCASDWAGGIIGGTNYPSGIYCFVNPAVTVGAAFAASQGYHVVDRATYTAMFGS